MEDSRKKGVLTAIAVFVIGIAAGVLFAPKSGKETRQDIADGSKKAKREAQKSYAALTREVNRLTEKVKKKAKKLDKELDKELDVAEIKAEIVNKKIQETIEELKSADKKVDEDDVFDALKKEITKLKRSVR